MSNKGEKNAKIIGVIFFTFCLIYIIHEFVKKNRNSIEVEIDYEKTYGWINSYWDRDNSDSGSGRTIGYQYKVGEQVFLRKIYTHIKFLECDDSLGQECLKKRFWVIYSKKNPSKSLINLTIEIQDAKDLEFPQTITDFK